MAKKTRKGPDFGTLQKQLNQELGQGVFHRIYILTGSQSYLRSQNEKKLLAALLEDGDTMNLTLYTGEDLTAETVIDQAETLPFFADRRVILFRGTGILGKAGAKLSAVSDKLASYIGGAPETTFFIFNEENTDARKKLWKACAPDAFVLPCADIGEAMTAAWTRRRFTSAGLSIGDRVLAGFLARTGDDLARIAAETDKLTAYCWGRDQVTERDVAAIVSIHLEDRIFDMIGAIASGQTDRALSLYMDLLALQTEPQPILALLGRQMGRLLEVRELAAAGRSQEEIGKAIGLHPYVVRKEYLPLARRFAPGQLETALEACAEADQIYKTGRMTDRIAVEVLLTGLCTGRLAPFRE